MLVCSPTGYIYFISKSYPGKIFKLKIIYIGSNNDIGIYKLYENLIHRHLDKDEAICADAGYRGLQTLHTAILPFIDVDSKDSTYLQKQEFNNHLAHYRIVVENVFSQIKNWNICSFQF